jgi:hypothetical protein
VPKPKQPEIRSVQAIYSSQCRATFYRVFHVISMRGFFLSYPLVWPIVHESVC